MELTSDKPPSLDFLAWSWHCCCAASGSGMIIACSNSPYKNNNNNICSWLLHMFY